MMKAIIKYIDTVEENVHSVFSVAEIEGIVGYNYRYFNKKFKSVVGMTPDKYRVRRQLTLIALEIKNNTGIIKKSNLLPWADESSFLKAFKREFNMTPSTYIKGTYDILQEKIYIKPIKKEKTLLNELVEEINNLIIENRYNISTQDYKKYISLIDKYYKINKYLYNNDNSTHFLSLVYIGSKEMVD